MKAVVEVLLKGPGELRVFNVAGMNGRAIDVGSGDLSLEADDEFDATGGVGLRLEEEEQMLVAREFGTDAFDGSHCLRL